MATTWAIQINATEEQGTSFLSPLPSQKYLEIPGPLEKREGEKLQEALRMSCRVETRTVKKPQPLPNPPYHHYHLKNNFNCSISTRYQIYNAV